MTFCEVGLRSLFVAIRMPIDTLPARRCSLKNLRDPLWYSAGDGSDYQAKWSIGGQHSIMPLKINNLDMLLPPVVGMIWSMSVAAKLTGIWINEIAAPACLSGGGAGTPERRAIRHHFICLFGLSILGFWGFDFCFLTFDYCTKEYAQL